MLRSRAKIPKLNTKLIRFSLEVPYQPVSTKFVTCPRASSISGIVHRQLSWIYCHKKLMHVIMLKFQRLMVQFYLSLRGEEVRHIDASVLKLQWTRLWVCKLVVIILSSLVHYNNAISHDNVLVGYRERPLTKHSFDQGVSTIKHEYLILRTQYGEIKVELATFDAPLAVEYVKSLVNRGLMKGCSFYRAEPAGPTIDENRDGFRQGYALLQGGLYSCGRQETNQLPIETNLNITRGSVSLITGTSEFFFSLEAHPEWDGSFSVWGEVVGLGSWVTMKKIMSLPTRQEVHSSGTVLRMLLSAIMFEARLESSRS